MYKSLLYIRLKFTHCRRNFNVFTITYLIAYYYYVDFVLNIYYITYLFEKLCKCTMFSNGIITMIRCSDFFNLKVTSLAKNIKYTQFELSEKMFV